MKSIFYIFYCLFHLSIMAQNWKDVTHEYITNPSFEDYTACPQSNSAYPNSMWIDSVVGWYAPTQGTSDYFNACNLNNLNSVPNNTAVGFQYAYDGVGYCGFLAYELILNNPIWCEYIQTNLITPLKPNTKYLFSMRINRANGYNLSVKNIGAHFSNTSMQDYTTTEPYNFTPTVLNTTGYLNDTMNWMLVKGEFIASGNEQYLTIGWFGHSNSEDFFTYFFIPPDIDPITGDSLYVPYVYYAVDSLKLYEWVYDIENFNINVLTPNNDGVNDYLDFSNYNLSELNFTVFNRWGNLVFSSINTQLVWDGKTNEGKALSDGTYYYLINTKTSENKPIVIKNFITIFTNP
ncbi:MAG: gliding motility-associated C-terminal domain-containing protein [Bacteroidia bacterium]